MPPPPEWVVGGILAKRVRTAMAAYGQVQIVVHDAVIQAMLAYVDAEFTVEERRRLLVVGYGDD